MFHFVSLCIMASLTCLQVPEPSAGDGYQITSKKPDGTTITYELVFGPTMVAKRHLGFDPASKEFVYLTWNPDREDEPKPVCSIFDVQTGVEIPLYKFPNVEYPLPIIRSIREFKVCPITGDKNPKIEKSFIAD